MTCSICLDNININDVLSNTTLPCEHVFHDACLRKWTRFQNNCPLCREQIYSVSEREHLNRNVRVRNAILSNANIEMNDPIEESFLLNGTLYSTFLLQCLQYDFLPLDAQTDFRILVESSRNLNRTFKCINETTHFLMFH